MSASAPDWRRRWGRCWTRSAPGLRVAGTFDGIAMHCPEPVVEAAVGAHRDCGADTALCIGGGSTVALAKILRAEHGAKTVMLPTTYSGSEVTPVYGRRIGLEKVQRTDPEAIPDRVIYDPDLTLDLPPRDTAGTGMNCLAHAVEALYPAEPNPVARYMAERTIAALAEALPVAVAKGRDASARAAAPEAGFMGGTLVAMAGMALHHGLAHVIGGRWGIDHGDCNAALLPHIVAFNAPGVPALEQVLCPVFGGDDPASAVFDFVERIGGTTALGPPGLEAEGIPATAAAMCASGRCNPRPYSAAAVERIFENVRAGVRPGVESCQDL